MFKLEQQRRVVIIMTNKPGSKTLLKVIGACRREGVRACWKFRDADGHRYGATAKPRRRLAHQWIARRRKRSERRRIGWVQLQELTRKGIGRIGRRLYARERGRDRLELVRVGGGGNGGRWRGGGVRRDRGMRRPGSDSSGIRVVGPRLCAPRHRHRRDCYRVRIVADADCRTIGPAE